MSGIVRFEVGRFDYELVGEFKFFKTPVRPSIVVRLTDENGVQGWGQSVPVETWTYETVETVETTLRVGDSWRCEQKQVKLSWTIQSPTLAGAEIQLALARTRGYDSFNIKLGYPRTPDYDLQLVRAVCNFAPNGFHWADANTNYDVETALAMAPKLADAGLEGLESPLPPNLIRGYQSLKRQGALPILMDEGIVSPVEVAEFIALEMFDGIAMKVARCGGLWNASRIVTLLRENNLLMLASGLTDPDLSLAASVHLFAWAGLNTPAALNGPQYISAGGHDRPDLPCQWRRHPCPGGTGAWHNAR